MGVGVLDMRLKLCLLTSYVQPAAKEIPRRAHLLRIDVGHWKHPTSKQGCYFLGVDLVVLHLCAVDRLHVQRVAQNELDTDDAAQIRHPVLGKDALNGQGQVLPVRLEHISESLSGV